MKLFFSMFMLIALSVAATAQNLTLGVKGGGSFRSSKVSIPIKVAATSTPHQSHRLLLEDSPITA